MTSDEEETFYQNEGGGPCRICGAPRRYKHTEPYGVRIFVVLAMITIIAVMIRMCGGREMMV
jgi:hypothetical protein